MKVKFWGVRGSIPSPGPSTARYGGNTSCIQVIASDELLIFDAGTGIRELGAIAMRDNRPLKIHILLSHTHWDHIQGLPFFAPLYDAQNHVTIHGPQGLERSLEDAVMIQMQRLWFPVKRSELHAKIAFAQHREEAFTLGPVEISTRFMNHPVITLAYRIGFAGKRIVYTGDNEPYSYFHVYSPGTQRTVKLTVGRAEAEKRHAKLIEFVTGVDLLIADSQYTDKEYETKVGWGHSSLSHVCRLAVESKVRRLSLFHHEPSRSDEDLDRLGRAAQQFAGDVEVSVAQEGAEISL